MKHVASALRAAFVLFGMAACVGAPSGAEPAEELGDEQSEATEPSASPELEPEGSAYAGPGMQTELEAQAPGQMDPAMH